MSSAECDPGPVPGAVLAPSPALLSPPACGPQGALTPCGEGAKLETQPIQF